MAIETDNPIDEEIDIEEEAVVSLPEDGEEEAAPSPPKKNKKRFGYRRVGFLYQMVW